MEKSVAGAPHVSGLRHNLATILASLGDIEGAQAQFLAAIKINPYDAQAFFSLTQNKRHSELDSVAEAMLGHLDSNLIRPELLQYAHYGLAKVFDDLRQYDTAFEHASIANALDKRPHDFQIEDRRLEQLRDVISSFHVPAFAGEDNKLSPIFIIGMPRSGTTLVEAILSRHSAVYAHGEQSFLPKIETSLTARFGGKSAADADVVLSNVPANLFAQHAEGMRRFFGNRVDNSATYFTDKLPHNAERIGLIAKMFPNAKIVHVKRHPLDSGLSNYFTRFNAGNGYANDMEDIGRHFANVAHSVDQWASMPGINILRMRYEDLVADPRASASTLLDYLDLEWEEACLDPAKGQKGVLTASQWQVRQPIYRGSVERWRNYKDVIGPMIDGLGGQSFMDAYLAD